MSHLHSNKELLPFLGIDATIPFDSLVLDAVIRELSDRLSGGKIQEIRHPEPNEVHIGIHTRSGVLRLLISIDAKFARTHLTTSRAANSSTPTEFCSAMRRHIEGGRVESVVQVGMDRIMELGVTNSTENGSQTHHRLIVELMGKHSNIILVNDGGRIIEAARRVSRRINRFRETLPGLPYISPPGIFDAPLPSIQEIAEAVVRTARGDPTLQGLAVAIRKCAPFASPFLATEIALRCTIQDCDAAPYRQKFGINGFLGQTAGILADRIGAAFETIFIDRLRQPVVSDRRRDAGVYAIPMLHIPANLQEPSGSINAALDRGYSGYMRDAKKREASGRLATAIDRELERQARVAASLSRTIEEGSRIDYLTQGADLLLANLRHVTPGDAEVTVTDYYDENGADRTIRLRPDLSPQENAEAIFDRARRSRQGLETARGRFEKTSAAIAALSDAQLKVKELASHPETDSADFQKLARSMADAGLLREDPGAEAVPAPQFEGHRIRREITSEGFEILVGESATANDFLTTRIAKPDDVWLHVRSASGGHVVIRTNGKPDSVPEAVLERAATIGALHSAQKHSSLVAVDYTLKKYVRKPRGAAAGSVVIEREKTIHVSPTATRDS